ncbi:MAG: PepSY domain-containing protein [Chthoniobacterales bacterium]
MKRNKLIALLSALALVAGLGTHILRAEDDDDDNKDQAKLAAEAKVSQADAQKTALAAVPNGTVKEAELEMEDGALIWSFDLSTPGTKDTTEVTVDAKTGKLVSTKVEKEDDDDDHKGGKDDDKD